MFETINIFIIIILIAVLFCLVDIWGDRVKNIESSIKEIKEEKESDEFSDR